MVIIIVIDIVNLSIATFLCKDIKAPNPNIIKAIIKVK